MIRAGNEKLDNKTLVVPVKAGENISEATLVALDAAGYAVTATAALSLTAAGVAIRPADNRLGANGDISAVIRRGAFVFDNSSTSNAVQKTDLLKPCYIENCTTVTMSDTETSQAGKVLAVEDDGITVEIL